MSSDNHNLRIEVYSSVGGSASLRRLMKEWEDRGAHVTAYHALSESEYRASGGILVRIRRRWRMYVVYGWMCWRTARGKGSPPPIRVVTTNPFFAPSWVARLAAGRGRTVNLVYDLFPEALIQAGLIAANSWIASRCASITRYAFRECAVSVFLGDRLFNDAERAHGSARRAVVIPVGADGSPFISFRPLALMKGAIPRILYCGLMGSMHEIDTVGAVLDGVSPAQVEWRFQANGSGYARLRRLTKQTRGVIWGGPLGDEIWAEAMKSAQVGLVTISAGAERVVMPSKTYSAMVAGQAILAICTKKSDLADLVLKHDCGWVVEPADVAGLRLIVQRIADRPDEVLAKRRRSFEAGHRYYDTKPVSLKWLELFRELSVTEKDEAGRASSGVIP